MSKFARSGTPTKRTSPINVGGATLTHEGADAQGFDPKSELFLLAISNMVGESTFYESAEERDARFAGLVTQVAAEDPEWVARFVPFLRDEMNLRSVSLVTAAEYVAAGAPGGRAVVSSALQRADEPAEMLAYWSQTHGRKIPQPVKRGVADAVQRLYTDRAALKYDGKGAAWRMGDVIELTHPKPRDENQSLLFKYLLDRRHHPDNLGYVPSRIQAVANWVEHGAPVDHLPEIVTWERLSSHRQMDKEAWEAVIPNMGYMALLRNLRNFELAGVSERMLASIGVKLSDPDEVAKSRQLPIRFFSAFNNVPSERFSGTLEKALDLALQNVPRFGGRTLILIDCSGSMQSHVSGRSQVTANQLSALFGGAVGKRSDDVKVVAFGTTSKDVTRDLKSKSLLRFTKELQSEGRIVGFGTNIIDAFNTHYDQEDRVLLFTDMQAHPSPAAQALSKAVYVWDLGGYGRTPFRNDGNTFYFGGASDALFKGIALLEKGRDSGWGF